jgi:hypothetical protein
MRLTHVLATHLEVPAHPERLRLSPSGLRSGPKPCATCPRRAPQGAGHAPHWRRPSRGSNGLPTVRTLARVSAALGTTFWNLRLAGVGARRAHGGERRGKGAAGKLGHRRVRAPSALPRSGSVRGLVRRLGTVTFSREERSAAGHRCPAALGADAYQVALDSDQHVLSAGNGLPDARARHLDTAASVAANGSLSRWSATGGRRSRRDRGAVCACSGEAHGAASGGRNGSTATAISGRAPCPGSSLIFRPFVLREPSRSRDEREGGDEPERRT